MEIIIAFTIVIGLVIAAYRQGKKSERLSNKEAVNEILKEQANNDVRSLDDVEFGKLFKDIK
jgi:uncharacterized membrane protein